MTIRLYSYWRSSAAYRVRIALNIKEIAHEIVPLGMLPDVAEHRAEPYRSLNPQMLVPFLEEGEFGLAQSQAILEYLEETYPDPALLPPDQKKRAAIRSFCNSICCDVHPLNNHRVLQYLKSEIGAPQDHVSAWYSHWIRIGFVSAELTAVSNSRGGPFLFGKSPSLADACLIPQMYNARRFNVPLSDFPRLVDITNACNELAAFQRAAPEQQPDCPT